jgi:hypothetical protein
VAVAITLLQGHDGHQHVGILHKDQTTSELRMLHLAWHHTLKNSPPKDTYAWISPPIPKPRARQLAAFCRRVYRANLSGIPYAFSPATDCFDAHAGAFLLGPGRYGLTCATFVLAVFQSAGLPLIQYGTWPATRDGDEAWQRWIISQLREGGASPDHIACVESELGSVRYRPADAAGAAATEKLPAPFGEVQPLAEAILAKLRSAGLFT